MKYHKSARPSAYVLGTSLNALAVLRSLGRRGIRVHAVQRNRDDWTYRSRYNAPIWVDPKASQDELLEALVVAGRQNDEPPVLIPTGDVDVEFMSDHRDVLRNHFRFVLSDAEILRALLDKDAFYQLARSWNLPVPKTYYVSKQLSVWEVARQVTFPCVIKPRYSGAWQAPHIAHALGYAKILECGSPEELLRRYHSLENEAQDVVIQEMIPGREDQLHDVYVYLGPAGTPLADFCLQKVRTEPIAGRGGGTCVRSVLQPQLAEMACSFLQAIGYRGPAAVCFKRDARSRQFSVIEVNARLSLHHSLAAHCGIDFVYLLYLDSVGDASLGANRAYSDGVKWIAALADARVFRDYRREYGLSFRDWLASYRGSKTFGDWSWDDPWPLIRQCAMRVPSVLRKVW